MPVKIHKNKCRKRTHHFMLTYINLPRRIRTRLLSSTLCQSEKQPHPGVSNRSMSFSPAAKSTKSFSLLNCRLTESPQNNMALFEQLIERVRFSKFFCNQGTYNQRTLKLFFFFFTYLSLILELFFCSFPF